MQRFKSAQSAQRFLSIDGHSDPPVYEEFGVCLCDALEKATRADLMSRKALELPHRPGQKRLVDVSEHRRQCRGRVSPNNNFNVQRHLVSRSTLRNLRAEAIGQCQAALAAHDTDQFQLTMRMSFVTVTKPSLGAPLVLIP
jgi:hypothetical protein